MTRTRPTLPVVARILRDAGEPLTVREITERGNGCLPTKSGRPDTVVARDLSMDIKEKGRWSIFVRVKTGLYTLRHMAEEWSKRQRVESWRESERRNRAVRLLMAQITRCAMGQQARVILEQNEAQWLLEKLKKAR